MELVLIGKVLKPFGVQGKVKVYLYTDFAQERYEAGSMIIINEQKYTIDDLSINYPFAIIGLVEVKTVEDAQRLRDLEIYKRDSDIKALTEGEYFFRDLKDLSVYSNNQKIGYVFQVEAGVKHNYLRIKNDEGLNKLIPFIPQFIKKVDLENKCIDIEVIEGLL